MSKLHHYLSMIIFVSAVMLGVQAPNYVDQYVKRVDAHYREAQASFAKHQEAADLYHSGSVAALIEHYRSQSDPTFQSGADAIEQSHQRLQRFDEERVALQTGLWRQMVTVLLHGDRELMANTYRSFSANVPLNMDAAVCGILFGVVASVLYEFLLSLFSASLRRGRKAEHC